MKRILLGSGAGADEFWCALTKPSGNRAKGERVLCKKPRTGRGPAWETHSVARTGSGCWREENLPEERFGSKSLAAGTKNSDATKTRSTNQI
jgi:hypothetical protein